MASEAPTMAAAGGATPATAAAPTDAGQALALTDAQAAGLLGVSRSHFRAMVREGRAPSPVKLGRASRWRRVELVAWLDAGSPPRHRWQWQPTRQGGRP